jgi:hypothetical protein
MVGDQTLARRMRVGLISVDLVNEQVAFRMEDWPVIVRQPWLRLNKHGHDHNAEDGDLEDQLVIIRQPWLRLNEQDGDLED